MIVTPYKAEHLLDFQLQEGQLYSTPAITPEYAKMLEGQFSFAGIHEGKVLAVGGVMELWENRALVWLMVDRHAGPHFVSIHKAVKRLLDAVPYPRLEADTPCEFEPGHRWLKMLGFELEAPRMRSYRVDGGDSALYARVK